MDVSDDGAAAECLHGVGENVSVDRLHDIFHEFRTVALDSFPFLRGADSHVSDRFRTESVQPHPRFYVGKSSAGWKCDKYHAGLIAEDNTMRLCAKMLLNGIGNAAVDVPPELHDVRIGSAP